MNKYTIKDLHEKRERSHTVFKAPQKKKEIIFNFVGSTSIYSPDIPYVGVRKKITMWNQEIPHR